MIIIKEESKKDNSLIVTYKNSNGSYVKVSAYPISTFSFLAEDFSAMFSNIPFIEILDIFVNREERNKGIGSTLLKEVFNDYKNYAILTAAGASMKEYPEEPSDNEKISIVESLNPFYEKNGFKCVNNKIGCYQFKRTYLYTRNEIGNKIYQTIKEK